MKKRMLVIWTFDCLAADIQTGIAAEATPRVEKAKQHYPLLKIIAADKLSVTHHKLKINGRTHKVHCYAGFLQIKDEADKPRAELFFIAYERNRRR